MPSGSMMSRANFKNNSTKGEISHMSANQERVNDSASASIALTEAKERVKFLQQESDGLEKQAQEAIQVRDTALLRDLRAQQVINMRDLLTAKIRVEESSILYWESVAVEQSQLVIKAHANLDEVQGNRQRRIEELQREIVALKIETGQAQFAAAHKVLLDREREYSESGERAREHSERLRKLKAKLSEDCPS